jgi:cytochrome d ubiquinol oxidase subunit II
MMLAIYAVLDGFDFGVGILHRFVATNDAERRTVLRAIGPVWDGNEVWLIASGGVLFMAFPEVYAMAFSGFYLALMILLWLLILRGVAIEFRSHQSNLLWREFWDTVFSLSSAMLAIVFGAALGNLVRGVPIDDEGLAGMPLFTNFRTGTHPGLFDWYTLLVGLFSLIVLAEHGALYLYWRTGGLIEQRCKTAARILARITLVSWVVVTIATIFVQREVFTNLVFRPWSLVFPMLAFAGAWGKHYFVKHDRALPAFISSTMFLLGILISTMIGIYPNWLRSTIDPAKSLTATNTLSGQYGMSVALIWWSIGMLLACGYFGYLFTSMRGKVDVGSNEGY